MLIQFNEPNPLNAIQLIQELKAAGINVQGNPIQDADGTFWLNLDESKQSAAAAIVAAHVGVDTVPTVADKLASVGLSIEDLKAALA